MPYLGVLALLVAIGFLVIYFGGLRKSGAETFGEKIWWNNLRPVHAVLYFIFAILAFKKNKKSWVVLLIDVIIGFLSFIIHHSASGSFKLLFK